MGDIDYSEETPFKYLKFKILYGLIISISTFLGIKYYIKYDMKKSLKITLALSSIIILYLIYKYFNIKKYIEENPTFFSKEVSAEKTITIDKKYFKKPKDSHSFIFIFNLYIANFNFKYGKTKNIMKKGFGKNVCPEININSNVNDIEISFILENGQSNTIKLKDIPINKYINIALQFNDNTLEIYKNGLLINAYAYSSRPLFNNSDLQLFTNGGLKGAISNLFYSPKYHNTSEIRLKVNRMLSN